MANPNFRTTFDVEVGGKDKAVNSPIDAESNISSIAFDRNPDFNMRVKTRDKTWFVPLSTSKSNMPVNLQKVIETGMKPWKIRYGTNRFDAKIIPSPKEIFVSFNIVVDGNTHTYNNVQYIHLQKFYDNVLIVQYAREGLSQLMVETIQIQNPQSGVQLYLGESQSKNRGNIYITHGDLYL